MGVWVVLVHVYAGVLRTVQYFPSGGANWHDPRVLLAATTSHPVTLWTGTELEIPLPLSWQPRRPGSQCAPFVARDGTSSSPPVATHRYSCRCSCAGLWRAHLLVVAWLVHRRRQHRRGTCWRRFWRCWLAWRTSHGQSLLRGTPQLHRRHWRQLQWQQMSPTTDGGQWTFAAARGCRGALFGA